MPRRRRVYLHLGPPKTGTTYLQSLLEANTPCLQEQGILVAETQAQHHRVANELMGTTSPRGSQIPSGAVDRLRRRAGLLPGRPRSQQRALLPAENLARPASPRGAHRPRAARDLHTAGPGSSAAQHVARRRQERQHHHVARLLRSGRREPPVHGRADPCHAATTHLVAAGPTGHTHEPREPPDHPSEHSEPVCCTS